jgi:hypothetical protein
MGAPQGPILRLRNSNLAHARGPKKDDGMETNHFEFATTT